MLTLQAFSPAKGSTGAVRTAPIYFEIRVVAALAVRSSINVKISGTDAIINGVFQAGFTGAINTDTHGYNVYVQHAAVFSLGQVVSVHISASDDGTSTIIEDYSFTVMLADTVLPVTIANPKGGTFASQQNVSLIVSKSGCTIYYTVDGSIPTTSSSVYTIPIVIDENTSLKFFSVDTLGNQDYIHVEAYSFDTFVDDNVVPVTTPSIASGTYNETLFVVLTTSKPATVYWTTDGSTPTLTHYTNRDSQSTTITIESDTVLKFFAIDEFGNQEAVKTVNYIIYPTENNLVPANVFVNYPYIKSTVDISWDDMMPIEQNIIGYNVYRSQVDAQYLENIVSSDVLSSSDVYSIKDSTFIKINRELITTTVYRDQYLNRVVLKEDVSEQFKYSTAVDVASDFAGQVVDNVNWSAIDVDRIFNQSDGLHFTDVYGNNREAYFQSIFRLKDDFDIETKYDLYGWSITDAISNSEAAFIVAFGEYSYIKISRIRREAFDYYVSSAVLDSTEISRTELLTVSLEGKMRIVRSGSDISTYFHDGSSWVLIDSYMSFTRDNAQVKFYGKSSNVSIDVLFEYLHVTNVQAILPFLTDSLANYQIQVRHTPIATDRTTKLYTDQTFDVEVLVDGKTAVVKSVDGLKGVIILDTDRQYDQTTQKWFEPVVPHIDSKVTVSYQYNVNSLKMNLGKLPFYKVTAVLSDGSETRLEWCPSVTLESDKLDYMYLEAIRRNSWLLDQTGERVLLFIRKSTGEKCSCYKRNERTHGQAQVGSCKICWGTGFVGGYEGPFEIRVAPFQTDQKINMTERGMKLENVENTWTTISPTMSQRDMIVRRNSMIYAVGPISQPEVKGVAVQQHFAVESVDTTDIRYEFVASLNLFNYKSQIGLRKPFTHYTDDQTIVDGEVVENDRLRTDKGPGFDNKKGRTITFENMLT